MAAKKAPKPKIPNKRLKKASKAKPKKTGYDYQVRFGTRNELGAPRGFDNESNARNAIIAELKAWLPFCERYNSAGKTDIDEAVKGVGMISFHHEPDRIECIFDEHTGMHLVAEFWTTRL